MQGKKEFRKIRPLLCLFLVMVLLSVMIPAESALAMESETAQEVEESTEMTEDTEAAPEQYGDTEPDNEDLENPVLGPEEQEEVSDNTEPVSYANSISGIIWMDANEDGVYDSDEASAAGYEVSLYLSSDTGNAVKTTTTNGEGEYIFENIEPGGYVVGVKSEIINETEYLLPLKGYSGDNQFKIADDYINAYSNILTVDEDSVIADINAGMRRPPKITPFAAYTIDVSAPAAGTGYTYSSGTITFTSGASAHNYTITGTSTSVTIVVPSGVTVNMTLDGVDLRVGRSPIDVYGVANIILKGANTVRSTYGTVGASGHANAAIYVDPGGTLTIDEVSGGSGSLTATGGARGAGIGGGYHATVTPPSYNIYGETGRIIINGGTINAQGGSPQAAGIGGGAGGRGGNITITGGTVTATGAGGAAGIGGGYHGDGGNITITGGTVTAIGGSTGNGAAGIGGGYGGTADSIEISGGTVTATASGTNTCGAGIGGGDMSGITRGGGTIFTGSIMISGGTVVASNSLSNAAGIGSGRIGTQSNYVTDIEISGGTVTATGGGGSSGNDIGRTGDTVIFVGGSILPTHGDSYVLSPTNGTNGPDPVGMLTFSGYSPSASFSINAGGSTSNYTYNANAHPDGNVYVWLAYPAAFTDSASSSITAAVVSAPSTVTSPSSSTAVLNGTYYLNNTYAVANAYFEYGMTTSYGSTASALVSNTGLTGQSPESSTITGLSPGTTYHYRFVIETGPLGSITVFGEDKTFTTPALKPSLDAAHDVTGNTTATLYGIYDLNGGTFTNGKFELSTTGTGGPWTTLTDTSTPTVSGGTGVTANTAALDNSNTMPSVNLTNLTPNTIYYYQFTVTNSEGTSAVTGSWRQLSTTDLKINKTVTGTYGDPNKAFEITITLEDSGVPVTGTYAYTGSAISGVTAPANGSITFNASGRGIIHLMHGQTITITGLQQGYICTVQETDAAVTGGLYTATYSGTGTVSGPGDSCSETLGAATANVSIQNDRNTVPTSGLSGTNYRLTAVGVLTVLTMALTILWSYYRRRKCR